jgi:hypothetical protein
MRRVIVLSCAARPSGEPGGGGSTVALPGGLAPGVPAAPEGVAMTASCRGGAARLGEPRAA